MPRYALIVSYHGQAFHGWQSQGHSIRTAQAQLEAALAKVAAEPIKVQAAGRTDAGVHATRQVVHFDTQACRADKAWVMGVNSHLPEDLAVAWAGRVPEDFHARYSALARRYLYLIYNHPVRPALFASGLTHEHQPLDHQAMHQGAQLLLGERDFTSFRAAGCQSATPMREVRHARVSRQDRLVLLDLEANAFLYQMVRNIAGALIEVGQGRRPPRWIAQLLEAKDRTLAAKTAPASGLYLIDAKYPPAFALPPGPALPPLLASLG